MIARKVGLDPNSLATTAPDSSQLTDRIEALHNQALQIRNLALSFYEASHPPTREVRDYLYYLYYQQITVTNQWFLVFSIYLSNACKLPQLLATTLLVVNIITKNQNVSTKLYGPAIGQYSSLIFRLCTNRSSFSPGVCASDC